MKSSQPTSNSSFTTHWIAVASLLIASLLTLNACKKDVNTVAATAESTSKTAVEAINNDRATDTQVSENLGKGDKDSHTAVFETVWNIPKDGGSIQLPYVQETEGRCDFRILWGDEANGTALEDGAHITQCDPDTLKHLYAKEGQYHVKIMGTYDGWGNDEDVLYRFENRCTPDDAYVDTYDDCDWYDEPMLQLLAVKSFGNVGLAEGAFAMAENLVELPANDKPVAQKLTTLKNFFKLAKKMNQPLNHWDTQYVEDMSGAFNQATAFNQPLNHWNTKNVKSLNGTFASATSFNQSLNNWDTSAVESMQSTFSGASVFNQPLDNWKTHNVTHMQGLFFYAPQFNQPIGNWDTSAVTNMSGLFNNAQAFNQPLENWNTENVTTMSSMFEEARSFNQPLEAWATHNVESMARMFNRAEAFNQPLEKWHTARVTSMYSMFSFASQFNQPLANWMVEKVENMDWMFYDAKAFDQPLRHWYIQSLQSADSAFEGSGMSQKNICQTTENVMWTSFQENAALQCP